MNKKILKLLLLPWLVLPSVSCGNNESSDEFKQVSHNDFALRAIKYFNEQIEFSKVRAIGTCEYYRSHEIIQIAVDGTIKDKSIYLDRYSADYDCDKGIRNAIIEGLDGFQYFTLYNYICYSSDKYDYYVKDDGCKIEYDQNFGISDLEPVYRNLESWNNCGLLNSIDCAFQEMESIGRISTIFKLNFIYE